MDYDIFVSYAHQDKAFVDALVHSLEAVNIRCWYAPRDIPSGVEWPAAIPAAIKSSHVMLLVFSKNSNGSQEVAKELTIASNHKRLVVPVNLDQTSPNAQMEYHLSNRHWLDIYDLEVEAAIQRILECLQDHQHLFKKATIPTAPNTEHTQSKVHTASSSKDEKSSPLQQHPLFKPLLACLVLILLIGGWLWGRSDSSPTVTQQSKTEQSNTASVKHDAVAQDFAEALDLVNDEEYEDAFEILKTLEHANYPQAEMLLGDMYYSGLGVEKNTAKAAALYQRAANQGLAEAQYSLAYMYEQGTSVTQNIAKALELYQKAANSGHADAMYTLGDIYEMGVYLSTDMTKSFSYFLSAAEIGFVPAQYKVGIFYYEGQGVDKNQAEGLNWLYKAADGGDMAAKEFLEQRK